MYHLLDNQKGKILASFTSKEIGKFFLAGMGKDYFLVAGNGEVIEQERG